MSDSRTNGSYEPVILIKKNSTLWTILLGKVRVLAWVMGYIKALTKQRMT